MSDTPAQNTDRELWRERDDYYADSLHVTVGGGIGINCGGHVIVKPLKEWHRLAESPAPLSAPVNTTTSTAEGRTLACSTDESCSEDGVKATRIGTGKPIAAQLVGGAAPLSEPDSCLICGCDCHKAAPLSEEAPTRITEFGLVRESDGWYFDTPVFSQHESLKKLIEAYLRLRGAAFSEEAARREFEEWYEPNYRKIAGTSSWIERAWQVWLACAKKRAEV